jgi:predicted RNA-binding protein
MCQATVLLDGKEIMRDVMLVEPVPEDIRLVALFEPVSRIGLNTIRNTPRSFGNGQRETA